MQRRKLIQLTTLGLTASIGNGIAKNFNSVQNSLEFVYTGEKTIDKVDNATYESWMWIELIGFDNIQKDFGVKSFLDNSGFVPNAISFLLVMADFVNSHVDMEKEWTFPPDYCSYMARPTSKERIRQEWTNYQFRGLIKELQRYGIEVYCSFFDYIVTNDGPGSWAIEHPEVFVKVSNGDSYLYINPLKHLNDGSLYEDFFINNLLKIMQDYGFDGFHGADGISSGRRPLYDSDYSDDMVDQFVKHTGIKLPVEIAGSYNDNKEKFEKRSKWIWKYFKKEWINFHIDRWESFWKKVVVSLHKIEKKVVINTAWTRDPFEALYRYGVDYKRLSNIGIDGFIVEAVASSIAMEPDLSDDFSKIYYNSLAMLLLIKAYIPNTPLRPFTVIHDTREQYDPLRHIPTVVEREIYSMASLYIDQGKGKFKHCSSGPLGCLSDSLENHEWKWLKQRWNVGFSLIPDKVIGTTLLWSDNIFYNQLGDYTSTHRWTSHKLLYELLAIGTPVFSAANVSDIGKLSGPLLILNYHLLSDDELHNILAYELGPVIMIGGKVPLPKVPSIQFEDVYGPDVLNCVVYGYESTNLINISKEIEEEFPEEIPDPNSWTQSLYFRKTSIDFLKNCKQIISEASLSPKIIDSTGAIKLMSFKRNEKTLRLLIGNDSIYYVTPTINILNKIISIKVVTSFPGMPVEPFNGTMLKVRVPGRGMVILDVDIEES